METEPGRQDQDLDRLARDFSVSNYVRFRAIHPDADPFISVFYRPYGDPTGFDYVIDLKKELERFNISQSSVLATLDGYKDGPDRLCLELLSSLAERREKENNMPHSIANGLFIGDALIDFLICLVLESLIYHNLSIPNSYLILLQERSNIFKSIYVSNRMGGRRRKDAARLIAENPGISVRNAAKIVGVNHVTLYSWMKEESFKNRVDRIRRFDGKKFFKLVRGLLSKR